MKLLIFRYLIYGCQFFSSILVLEKLVDKDIYSFGIFQTLIGTLLYAQLGLPQNFIKQNINDEKFVIPLEKSSKGLYIVKINGAISKKLILY